MSRVLAALACAAAVALPAGCGLGEGDEQAGGATLRVTRDFGRAELGSADTETLREGGTVMRFLRSEFDVETRFGGGFVQSIDGLAGEGSSGRRDWFFFVNGVESDVGAAEYELSPGDKVQWDLRHWRAAMRVPAIVGAYPEPFRSGIQRQAPPRARGVRGGGGRALPGREGFTRARRRTRVGLVAGGTGHRDRDPPRGGALAPGAHRSRRARSGGRAPGQRRVRPFRCRWAVAGAARRGRQGSAHDPPRATAPRSWPRFARATMS